MSLLPGRVPSSSSAAAPGRFAVPFLSGRAGVSHTLSVLPGLRSPLRAAVLSDLHYGPLVGASQLRRWVDLALGVSPDLIVLPGDVCDVRLQDGVPRELLEILSRLHAPHGVFAVWGNHDSASFGRVRSTWTGEPHAEWREVREAFTAALWAVGVNVLQNTGLAVRPDVWLGGVDDFSTGDPDPEAALSGRSDAQATLLLMHQPAGLDALGGVSGWHPAARAICGHTHGGQIMRPGGLDISGVVSRRVSGWVTGEAHGTQPGARGHVSRGLGVTGLPARLFCPPEVVLHEFRPD